MAHPLIAVVDCAIKAPSLGCFNRLAHELDHKLEYHWPSHYGLSSLLSSRAQAFIVLGSFSNVQDRFEWQRELAVFLDAQLQQDKPVLGICFAHQLMADFYDSKVVAAARSHSGTRDIEFNSAAGDFNLKTHYRFIVQHSYEVVELSSSLICLASSMDCQNEVIAHKTLPFIGVQAHPEASEHFVRANFEADQGQVAPEAYLDGLDFLKTIIRQMNERILRSPQKPLRSQK